MVLNDQVMHHLSTSAAVLNDQVSHRLVNIPTGKFSHDKDYDKFRDEKDPTKSKTINI